MTSRLRKPTIVLIPGGWHGPETFKEASNLLQTAGYQTLALSLPSIGPPPGTESMDPDVQVIRKAVSDASDQGDVVVVFHSYGGQVGNNALEGLSKEGRGQEGKKGGVVKLVHMCSFVVPPGKSMVDNMGGGLMAWQEGKDSVILPHRPPEIFYNDLDSATAKYWTEKLQPQSLGSFQDKTKYAAWQHIPNTYIFCTKDAAIPIEGQEAMVKAAVESGARFDTERLEASHTPFLSMPKETADCIRRAAGETGLAMGVVDAVNNVRGEVS